MSGIRAIGIGLAVVCAACTPRFEDAEATKPSASLTFVKLDSGEQSFDISENGQCSDIGRAAALGPHSDDTKTRRVISGQRITLMAEVAFTRSTAVYGYVEGDDCKSAVSFVPEQGHSYRIGQMAVVESKTCHIDITDTTTGAHPATLSHNISEACRTAFH